MLDVLARNWWAVVLRGVVAVLFGILAFIWPEVTLFVLIALFGAFALVNGMLAVISAFRIAGTDRWWHVLEGVAGIVLGILTFLWPGITALVLVTFIAAWAIVTGIFQNVAAIRLRREIEGEWVLALAGLLSVIFGILLIVFPGAGALSLIWLISAYAIAFGVLLILLGLRLRGRREVAMEPGRA